MGILKSGWAKGIFFLFFVGGFLSAGIVVNHYLHAKAAGNEPSNQKKTNQTDNHGVNKLIQITNGSKVEKEVIRQHQNEAYLMNRQKTVQETSSVPENNPANPTTTSEQATTKDTASTPPPSETNPVQTEQKDTQQAVISPKTVYLTFDDGQKAFQEILSHY
ncbi:hypothetical protein NDK43_32260 [Neobacillus pocheonensis]|uniref:Polysaccharide deacetylase n=1 Tax=Neobacillus pocheonensis TaxID=363869 RepID=A0ABT0WLW3_9BACI|nr:hypothetical protein [Neobacillus pocheonensis]